MYNVWRRGEVHTGVWLEHLKERNHLEDGGVVRRIILKLDLLEVG
jgi:hypothetical protein